MHSAISNNYINIINKKIINHTEDDSTLFSNNLDPKLSIFKITRNLDQQSFDEKIMHQLFSQYQPAVDLEKKVEIMGYSYSGHTGSSSKAFTNHQMREIRINSALDPQTAALSYVYELSNASQQNDFENGPNILWRSENTNIEIAKNYAKETMKLEAKSILIRSQMAIAMNAEDLIVNKEYNKIAKDSSLSSEEKVNAIYMEMKNNGTVHQGRKKVFDHYIDMFINRIH